MQLAAAVFDSNHYIVSYNTYTNGILNLKFAIDSTFGVTSEGDVYAQKITSGSIESYAIKCRDLVVGVGYGSDVNEIYLKTDKLDLWGNDTFITAENTFRMMSPDNNPIEIDALQLSGSKIGAPGQLYLFDNNYFIDDDSFWHLDSINNVLYQTPFMNYGADGVTIPSNLPSGHIFLVYE